MTPLPAIFRPALAAALISVSVFAADAADNAAIFKTCIEKAEQLSKSISSPNKRDMAFSQVALAYAKYGDFEQTERILERNPNPSTILDLNFSRMRAERPEIARRLISIAKESVMRFPAAARDGLLWRIAYQQALNGQAADALETAKLAENPSMRENALDHISRARSYIGDIDGAISTAELMQPGRARNNAFAVAAGAIARSGDWKKARELAESGQSDRNSAYYSMAMRGAEKLDFETRLARVREIPEASSRITALTWLGGDSGRAGDKSAMRRAYGEAYQAILGSGGQLYQLPDIGVAQAKAGFIEDALETAKVVEGNLGARRLNMNGDSLVWLLGHIARAQYRIGQKDEARKTVASAEQVVSKDEYKNLSAVLELVRMAGETGDIDLARRLATLLPMPDRFSFNIASARSTETRPDAWKIIAVQLAKTGDYDAAFKMIDEISQTVGTDRTLAEIAVEQARQDRLADALKTVDRINDAPAKVGALTEMALTNMRPRPN